MAAGIDAYDGQRKTTTTRDRCLERIFVPCLLAWPLKTGLQKHCMAKLFNLNSSEKFAILRDAQPDHF